MPVDDLTFGWREMDDALPGYVKAEDAAAGRVDELFPDPKLEEKLSVFADRYRFPLAGIPIDVLSDRVELRDVATESAAADAKIAAIERANKLETRWPDLIRMAFTYGDAYLLVWPAPDASPTSGIASRLLAEAGVTVDLHNPKHCRVFYDEESERVPIFAIKRWGIRLPMGRAWRADVYYPGFVERYVSKVGTDPKDNDSWEPYIEAPAADAAEDVPEDDMSTAHILKTPTPDEIPIIHFRTGLPYGDPVHIAAFGCQDAVTKMLVTQLDTTDSHGWPQRWRLLRMNAELDQATDNPPWGDDDDADDDRPADGTVQSSQPSGPGTLQTFTGTDSVGQFEAASPAIFLEPATLYIRLMGLLTHIPMHYFDPDGGGVPSGESLKVANMPLVKRAARFEALLTGAIQEFWDYALRVVSMPLENAVDVRWAPAWSAVGASDWEEVTAKQQAGVPIPETLVEAGYPRDRVEEWNLPEHPADFDAPVPPPVVPVGVPVGGGVPVGPDGMPVMDPNAPPGGTGA